MEVLYCKAQKDRATAYLKAGRFREAVKKWDEVLQPMCFAIRVKFHIFSICYIVRARPNPFL